MPHFYLAEYVDLGAAGRGVTPFPQEPPIGEQVLDVGDLSVASDAMLAETCIVRLVSDVDCAIAVGVNPDATDSVRYLAAGREQLISVAAGSKMKVAVISNGGSMGSGSSSDTLAALISVVTSPTEAKKKFDDLAAQAAKASAATLDLRAANQETLAARDDLAKATAASIKERADADAAKASLADLKAQVDKKSADLDEKSKAFDTNLAERKADLDKRATDLIDGAKTLDAAKKDLQEQVAALAAREADLATKSAAADALAAEYESKLAKLKALTG